MLRYLVAPWRLLGVALLVLGGLLITGLVYPWLAQGVRNRVLRRWSRLLLWVCGARLRVSGQPLAPPLQASGIEEGSSGRLVIANHISWIDVFAINGALPCRFVAKAEIGDWPLLGSLVTLAGALYIERGRRHAVSATNHKVRDCLQRGETVALFPEGTTSDGSVLLPFHSNLVAPALEVGCSIWPVALRYTDAAGPSTAAAFVGDMGLLTSMWNIVVAPDLLIEVALLAPLPARADSNRHHIGQLAREAIAAHLGLDGGDPRALRRAAAARARPADPAPADTAPDAARDAAN